MNGFGVVIARYYDLYTNDMFICAKICLYHIGLAYKRSRGLVADVLNNESLVGPFFHNIFRGIFSEGVMERYHGRGVDRVIS